MFKRLKDIISILKARHEWLEHEKYCVQRTNEILAEGVTGQEWKLKSMDDFRAGKTGYFFPTFLSDEEYAIVVCRSSLDSPWINDAAKAGARRYLESKGYKCTYEKDLLRNVPKWKVYWAVGLQ